VSDTKVGLLEGVPEPDRSAMLAGMIPPESRYAAALAALEAKVAAEGERQKGIGTSPSAPEDIMQYFAHAHLPPALAAVSRPFGELADQVVVNLPRCPERTVTLRKLLEAKDAAVRAFIWKAVR
jgi:hypothetical protein